MAQTIQGGTRELVDSLALTKRSVYGRMRRRRLEADGEGLEMLSIDGQARLQASTVVHCGVQECESVATGRTAMQTERAPIWSQVQKRSSGSGCRGRVDEGKTWTRVSQHRGRPAASLSQSGPIISWISDAVPRSLPSTEPAPKRGRPAPQQRPRYLSVWYSVVCRPPTLVLPPALGRMPRMQSPGGLLVVRRGSWFP